MKEPLLVDTNALIALFDGDKAIATRLFEADRVLVPAIVCGEIDAGTRGDTKREQETRQAFEKFLALPSVSVLPITRRTGLFYANVYGYCKSVGRPIPTNDIWIAATAIENATAILTFDQHLRTLPLIRVVLP